jgi:hypothetical protein
VEVGADLVEEVCAGGRRPPGIRVPPRHVQLIMVDSEACFRNSPNHHACRSPDIAAMVVVLQTNTTTRPFSNYESVSNHSQHGNCTTTMRSLTDLD